MSCHQIGTQGGNVGPDLTSIGAYAQPAAILDSILNPNKDIKQGYETIILTRKDNTTVAGILQRQSDEATILRDPAESAEQMRLKKRQGEQDRADQRADARDHVTGKKIVLRPARIPRAP